ncbi:MAG: ATPase, partial [Actinomycetota bacterium]|nr:ATPase [Actinomycetota bacterium]
ATQRAHEVQMSFPARVPPGSSAATVIQPRGRRVRASSIDLRRGKRETARGKGLSSIELGRERVELSYLEQLAEAGQTEAIARIIGEFAAGSKSRGVEEVVRGALDSVTKNGLDSLGSFRGHPGEMSLPRAQEVSAAINRIRSLQASTRAG